MAGDVREQLDRLLAAFGEAGGLRLGTDEDGVARLVVDGRLQLYLVADPRDASLVMWIPLPALAEADRARLYRRLLVANLFWQGTEGTTLGLEPESEQPVLALRRPLADLDRDGLDALIGRIADAAVRIEALLADAEPAAAEPAPLPFAGGTFLHA